MSPTPRERRSAPRDPSDPPRDGGCGPAPGPARVVRASAFPGETASIRIDAAIRSGSDGGRLREPLVVDARDDSGTQVLSGDAFGSLSLSSDLPLTLLLGPATYRVSRTQQPPSRTRITLDGSTLVMATPDGSPVLATHAIGLSPSGSTAAVASGSAVITPKSMDGVVPGALIAVFGSVPRGGTDAATLKADLRPGDQTVSLDSAEGLAAPCWVRIEQEVLRAGGLDGATLTKCARGYGGTAIVAHAAGTPVQRCVYETHLVTTVRGGVAELDGAIDLTGGSISILVGHRDVAVDGWGTLDGNMQPRDDPANPYGLYALCARGVRTGRDVVFRNWDHGGVTLTASRDGIVDGVFRDNGRAALHLGAHVWLFGNARDNVVLGEYERGNIAVVIDDRSTHPQLYDNPSDRNIVIARSITDVGWKTFAIEGSSDNIVLCDAWRGGAAAIGAVIATPQWRQAGRADRNYVSITPGAGATAPQSTGTPAVPVPAWGPATLPSGITAPDVTGMRVVRMAPGASVVDGLAGTVGQRLVLLLHAGSTVRHGDAIALEGGVDLAGRDGGVLVLRRCAGNWREEARSA